MDCLVIAAEAPDGRGRNSPASLAAFGDVTLEG
jgi:hypothetical protein